MEYTQWDGGKTQDAFSSKVLILVVMEYTQWVMVMLSMAIW